MPDDRPIIPPCTGFCRGQRSVTDSPAQFGRKPDGTRGLWCPCCSQWLVLASAEDKAQKIRDSGRIDPGVETGAVKMYLCRACGFDIYLLTEVK